MTEMADTSVWPGATFTTSVRSRPLRMAWIFPSQMSLRLPEPSAVRVECGSMLQSALVNSESSPNVPDGNRFGRAVESEPIGMTLNRLPTHFSSAVQVPSLMSPPVSTLMSCSRNCVTGWNPISVNQPMMPWMRSNGRYTTTSRNMLTKWSMASSGLKCPLSGLRSPNNSLRLSKKLWNRSARASRSMPVMSLR